MIGWVGDIERLTLDNDTFRTVLFTGAHTQLTVMRLAPGEDIGKEVHPDRDQFIRIEEGQARVEVGRDEDGVDESHDVSDEGAIVIPGGAGRKRLAAVAMVVFVLWCSALTLIPAIRSALRTVRADRALA